MLVEAEQVERIGEAFVVAMLQACSHLFLHSTTVLLLRNSFGAPSGILEGVTATSCHYIKLLTCLVHAEGKTIALNAGMRTATLEARSHLTHSL